MKKKSIFLAFGTVLLSSLLLFAPVSSKIFPQTQLTVEAASKSILNYKTKHLIKGESFTLEADTTKKVTYTSKRPAVASVSNKGVVK